MALLKTITLKDNFGQDVTFSNAYIRVDSVSGGKDNLSALVGYYKDKDAQQFSVTRVAFVPAMNNVNFIQQSYQHLKTLPEFKGAQDC